MAEDDGINVLEGIKDKPIISMEVEQRLNSMPIMPESEPLKLPDFKEKPGFFKTLGHAALETNDFINVAAGISHSFSHTDEDAPANWSSVKDNDDIFLSVPPKFWGSLASATGPLDQQRILEWAKGQEQEDEYYSSGSMVASMIGGLSGGITSPSAWIPLSAAVKYANVGKNVIANTLKTAPALATSSLAHEAALQVGNDSRDISELAFNTARDTVYGAAFVAGTTGISSAFSSYSLNNAKVTLNAADKNVNYEANISKDGKFLNSYKATPSKGQNVSAAVVDHWQDIADNTLVKSGMFALPVIGKLFTKLNPIVKGLTHPYESIRLWMNRISDHSLNVEGVKKGLAQGPNAEELFQQIRNSSKMLDVQLAGFWLEANGIEGGNQLTDAIAKQFKQRVSKDGFMQRSEFNHQVQTLLLSDTLSANKSINAAAELTRKHIDFTWDKFREAFDMPENYLPPATARAYLMKNYNMDAISQNEGLFHKVISNELLQQDEIISSLNRPVIEAKANLSKLKATKKLTAVDQKVFATRIEVQEIKVKRLEEHLDNELRDNPDFAILLEKRNRLTSSDIKKVNVLSRNLDNLNKDLTQSKKSISNLKSKISVAERGIIKAKTQATKNSNAAKVKSFKEDLNSIINSNKELQGLIDEELSNISGLAQAGQINSRYFTKNPETGFISLVKISEDAPKLRSVFADDNARLAAAKSWQATITGFTPEQVSQGILSQLAPHIGASPLTARTLMISDEALHEAGFLSNELSKNVAVYDLVLGKRTVMKELFPEFEGEEPIFGMARLIVEEREVKRAEVLSTPEAVKNPTSPEVLKQLKEIDKDAKDAKEFVKNSYNILMGRTNASLTTQKITSILKNFTITTLLGAVPLTQAADLGGLILKGGLWSFARDGLFPLLKSTTTLMKGKSAVEWKQDAGHAQLAIEHLLHGHMDKLSNPGSVEYIPDLGRTASAFKKMAEVSGNLFGTTYIDNQLQRMSAHMTQSKIMDFMFKYEAGDLSKRNLEILLRSGINPKIWAKKFISNFKNSNGEKTSGGGFNTRWYDWADDEAKNIMSTGIQRTLRETILKRGLFDNPFFTNSPILNTFLLFKGWVFSATTRYTLPLMQRANAQDAISILFMLAAGSMVDPLRRIARGESPDYNSDGAFLSSISNSGVLGYIFDAAEVANAFSGQSLGKTFLGDSFYKGSDRYQQRTILGVLAGPVGGMAESLVKVLTAFGNNEITEADAKRAIKMLPFTQAWYLRWLTNQISEGMGLPKTKAEARDHSTAIQGLYS